MAVKQNPMTRNGKDAKTKIMIYNMDTTSYFAHVKWISATPGAGPESKIDTGKEMNNLKEREDLKKTKTNVG